MSNQKMYQDMEEHLVCIDLGSGFARTYAYVASSGEEAIEMAMNDFPEGRDYIIVYPGVD